MVGYGGPAGVGDRYQHGARNRWGGRMVGDELTGLGGRAVVGGAAEEPVGAELPAAVISGGTTLMPGGSISRRPLHCIILADCSGSMRGEKMQALNFAIAEMLPTWWPGSGTRSRRRCSSGCSRSRTRLGGTSRSRCPWWDSAGARCSLSTGG